MQVIDTSKSLLENAYYFSGILILITVIVGIWQILLTKKTFKINSQREAALLAVKQIEIYTTYIIPLIDKLKNLKHYEELQYFNIDEFNLSTFKKKLAQKK